MKYILIDDDSAALKILALAIKDEATNVMAIWANPGDIALTGLGGLSSLFSKAGKTFKYSQAKDGSGLASLVNDCAKDISPTVLCSDLNMGEIIEVNDSGWFLSTNVVRLAVSKFAECRDHLVCLHSSTGNVSNVASKMGGENSRVFKLLANLSGTAYDRAVNILVDEVKEKIALADKTPFEKVWVSSEATHWYAVAKREPQHDWTGSANRVYKDRISNVLNDAFPAGGPELPDGFWNEAFHEAVKGVVGGTFCGTNGGTSNSPLRLGGVVFMATMAYAVERMSFGAFESVWGTLNDVRLIKRRFLNHTDPIRTKATCVALWWLFRKLFQIEPGRGGNVTNLVLLPDGLEIVFSWDTAPLFGRGREIAASVKPVVGGAYSIPATTRDALACALAALSFEPGGLFSGLNSIRVQAVSE